MFESFLGTKKYHNYTKDIKATEMTAMRFMMELSANEFMYVNKNTCSVTDATDPDSIEFVHFHLKGQAFLYNQIRKMIGCIIQVSHGQLGPQFVANTHKDNVMNVALAPGQGLLLEEVSYDKYNRLPATQQPVMLKLVSQKKEIEEFRKGIVGFIARREVEERVFTKWLCWFDDNKEDHYVSLNKESTLK